MNSVLSGKHLPSPDGHIDISGVDLKTVATASGPLRRQKRRTRSAKVSRMIWLRSVQSFMASTIRAMGLNGWMGVQSLPSCRPERICPGIMPDVRAVAANDGPIPLCSGGAGYRPERRRSAHAGFGKKLPWSCVGFYPRDQIEASRRRCSVRRRPVLRHGANPCKTKCTAPSVETVAAAPSAAMRKSVNSSRDISPDAIANSGCFAFPRPTTVSNRHVVRRIKECHMSPLAID